jgi:hypothetical protein
VRQSGHSSAASSQLEARFSAARGTFHLRDPDSGEVFPFQGAEVYGGQEAGWKLPLGESSLYLRLANSSACFLVPSLPFSAVNPTVRAYVARLESALPFRLSPKQWARWQLNAQGTRYHKRRITFASID